jgi:tetratricopeptide (TPR) repeat protein
MKKWCWFCVIMMMTPLVYAQEGYNFGDYRSTTLVTKAWEALEKNNATEAIIYANKCIKFYAKQAFSMQESLREFPAGSNDNIFKYWALNDVGTALFILGEAYRSTGQYEQEAQAYKRLINEYSYAQCWDPKGWFWKPAAVAERKLVEEEDSL